MSNTAPQSSNIVKPKYIVAVLLLLLVVSATAMYIFVWRTPDTVYASALQNVANLKDHAATIDAKLSALSNSSASDINITATELIEAHNSFEDSFSEMANSKVISKDASYKNNEASIQAYRESVKGTVDTVNAYLVMSYECNTLLGQVNDMATVTDFESKSTKCYESIEGIDLGEDESFKNSYSMPYAVALEKLIDAHRTLIIAKPTVAPGQPALYSAFNGIRTAEKNLADTAAKTEIKIDTVVTAPTNSFDEITAGLNSQKAALIR